MIAMAFGLVACTAPSQVPYALTTPYSEADFRPSGGPGPASVTGPAFMKTVGGEVRTCAGEDVALFPATAYNREIVQSIRQGHENLSNRNPATDAYVRHATCDAQGNFAFAGVPAGTWFVWGNVNRDVPGDYGGHQGGRLIKEVTVVPGANRVLLTDADFMG